MPAGYPSNGPCSTGYKTEAGRTEIVRHRVSNGAQASTEVLPGEDPQDWSDHLEGLRTSLGPANYHEEEIIRNIARSYSQLRRVHQYEVAQLREQIEDESGHYDGEEIRTIIEAGVETLQAQIAECHRVLELLGLERTAEATALLDDEDARLLLRYVLGAVSGHDVSAAEAFTDLPPSGEGWTWESIRSRLIEIAEAAGKPLDSLLGKLHTKVLERCDMLRETVERGMHKIRSNYLLHNGRSDLLLLYQTRLTNKIAKQLFLFGQAKADRLGLTTMTPMGNGNSNGDEE